MTTPNSTVTAKLVTASSTEGPEAGTVNLTAVSVLVIAEPLPYGILNSMKIEISHPEPKWPFPCFIWMKDDHNLIFWAMGPKPQQPGYADAVIAYGPELGKALNNCLLEFYEPVPASEGLSMVLVDGKPSLQRNPVPVAAPKPAATPVPKGSYVPAGTTFPFLGIECGYKILFMCPENIPGRELFAGGYWCGIGEFAEGRVSDACDREISEYQKISGKVTLTNRGIGRYPQIWTWRSFDHRVMLRTGPDAWFWVNNDGTQFQRSDLNTEWILGHSGFVIKPEGATVTFNL